MPLYERSMLPRNAISIYSTCKSPGEMSSFTLVIVSPTGTYRAHGNLPSIYTKTGMLDHIPYEDLVRLPFIRLHIPLALNKSFLWLWRYINGHQVDVISDDKVVIPADKFSYGTQSKISSIAGKEWQGMSFSERVMVWLYIRTLRLPLLQPVLCWWWRALFDKPGLVSEPALRAIIGEASMMLPPIFHPAPLIGGSSYLKTSLLDRTFLSFFPEAERHALMIPSLRLFLAGAHREATPIARKSIAVLGMRSGEPEIYLAFVAYRGPLSKATLGYPALRATLDDNPEWPHEEGDVDDYIKIHLAVHNDNTGDGSPELIGIGGKWFILALNSPRGRTVDDITFYRNDDDIYGFLAGYRYRSPFPYDVESAIYISLKRASPTSDRARLRAKLRRVMASWSPGQYLLGGSLAVRGDARVMAEHSPFIRAVPAATEMLPAGKNSYQDLLHLWSYLNGVDDLIGEIWVTSFERMWDYIRYFGIAFDAGFVERVLYLMLGRPDIPLSSILSIFHSIPISYLQRMTIVRNAFVDDAIYSRTMPARPRMEDVFLYPYGLMYKKYTEDLQYAGKVPWSTVIVWDKEMTPGIVETVDITRMGIDVRISVLRVRGEQIPVNDTPMLIVFTDGVWMHNGTIINTPTFLVRRAGR